MDAEARRRYCEADELVERYNTQINAAEEAARQRRIVLENQFTDLRSEVEHHKAELVSIVSSCTLIK